MSDYRLSPAAQRDLSQMWDYTEERWGVSQAEVYIEDIKTAVERVAADPGRGRACDEIRAGYWRYPTGRRLIFYVRRDSGIDVIRVLHHRIDPTRHL